MEEWLRCAAYGSEGNGLARCGTGVSAPLMCLTSTSVRQIRNEGHFTLVSEPGHREYATPYVVMMGVV
jgi:hypothetical protein